MEWIRRSRLDRAKRTWRDEALRAPMRRLSDEANGLADRFHNFGNPALDGTRARGRRRTCGPSVVGPAPVDGGVLRVSLREAARVHAHADGPACPVPRGGVG